MYGASVSFNKTIIIYNADDEIVFQRTLEFNKASDMTINELEPSTDTRIVIDIHKELYMKK